MNIYDSYEGYETPKILFYDVKTGETLFDYTLDDYIRDNPEEVFPSYSPILCDEYDGNTSNEDDSQENISINNHLTKQVFLEKSVLIDDKKCYVSSDAQNYVSSNTQKDASNKNSLYISRNKGFFVKFNSSSGIINIFKRPINNLKNTYIEKIVPFSDKEIDIYTKIFFSKKIFINNPSTVYYINGDVYKGEINKKLQMSGYGTLYFANGDKLDVKWVKNIAEGFGKYIYFDGTVFKGYWINNIFQNNQMLTPEIMRKLPISGGLTEG